MKRFLFLAMVVAGLLGGAVSGLIVRLSLPATCGDSTAAARLELERKLIKGMDRATKGRP